MDHRPPTTEQDELLAPRHAGELLGIGDDRVRELVREGALPASRLPDGRIVLRRKDVVALAEARGRVPDGRTPAWPCDRVHGAITAARQTAFHEVMQVALAHDDPVGAVMAYARGAELLDIVEDALYLALADHQLAAGLDQPHRVELLADALTGAYGFRVEVHVVNARTGEDTDAGA